VVLSFFPATKGITKMMVHRKESISGKYVMKISEKPGNFAGEDILL
jgi:hypothetical protein